MPPVRGASPLSVSAALPEGVAGLPLPPPSLGLLPFERSAEDMSCRAILSLSLSCLHHRPFQYIRVSGAN